MLKLAVLMENTAHTPQFACEHGWSVHVETPRHRLLFDAGQSPAFLDNARTLGIGLDKADTAVLSHGHYDHSGGLEAFLRINHQAPEPLCPGAPLPRPGAVHRRKPGADRKQPIGVCGGRFDAG